jgi:putative PIN family toxin of toxin-antitoxin system
VRIFFDTNVLFSAFGYPGLCLKIFRECSLHHTIVISTYVIEELERNLKAKLGATKRELVQIREQLISNCEIIDAYGTLDFPIRDSTDVPILSAAVAARSDMLVSGDKDLLVLVDPPVKILSPRALHDLLFGVKS